MTSDQPPDRVVECDPSAPPATLETAVRRGEHDIPPPWSVSQVMTMCDRLAATLQTADALVRGRRRIDLAGLDQQVQHLCVLIIALPPDNREPLQPRLRGLLVGVDTLLASLARPTRAG